MKKEFDFDEELDKLEDEESDHAHTEHARIVVTVIPFVLIIIILAVSLLVNKGTDRKEDNQELQESIKEYADSKQPEETLETLAASGEEETATPLPSEAEKEEPERIKTEETDYSKISFDQEAQLQEMMIYWADNNQQALDDLANLEHFRAMSFTLRDTSDFYYYGDKDAEGKPNGMGIAVYADNQYYYGSWQSGVRSGEGTWIHYHMQEAADPTDLYTYHQYTGSWKNDLPDGEGSEHYDYHMELLEENVGYNVNLIGSYKEGLIDGEFYLTNIYSDGNVKEWHASAEKGSWIYQNDNQDPKGRRPVQVEDRDPDNYIWLHPDENKNIGVCCLISAQKN